VAVSLAGWINTGLKARPRKAQAFTPVWDVMISDAA